MTLKLPQWMLTVEYDWLTEEYIIENGKYPEKPEIFDSMNEEDRFIKLDFSDIPMMSTDDIEAGDILIFFDGDGEDTFYLFTDNDIDEYNKEERMFLAHGVIVKPPIEEDDE